MKHFYKIVILVYLFFYSGYSVAQNQKDKVAELRVAFISKKLELLIIFR